MVTPILVPAELPYQIDPSNQPLAIYRPSLGIAIATPKDGRKIANG